MADWFIATEGVKVVKDSASLWPQIITAGAALGAVYLTHHFTRGREERAAAKKAMDERKYLTTELVFLLERYAVAWMPLKWKPLSDLCASNSIPALDVSQVKGEWRVLQETQIFKIRSLEVNQAVLSTRIKYDEESLHHPAIYEDLVHDCLKTSIHAYILAAKLRRAAGLKDAADLKDKEGVLGTLRRSYKDNWHRKVLTNKRTESVMQNIKQAKNNLTGDKDSDGANKSSDE